MAGARSKPCPSSGRISTARPSSSSSKTLNSPMAEDLPCYPASSTCCARCLPTAGQLLQARLRMALAGIPVPARLVTADDVEQGKPNPAPYLAGAALLGLPPDDCVVFE